MTDRDAPPLIIHSDLVAIYEGDLDGPFVTMALTDEDGDYCLELAPNESYGVRSSSRDERFLDVAGIWDAPAESAPMPGVTLLLGDLDDDDVIDTLDGSILQSAHDCDAPAAPAIFEDLDADGVVCDGDIDIVVQNTGAEGPLAWIFGIQPTATGEGPSPIGIGFPPGND